ncbi:G-box binding factor [Striga asiatica]|uniref:G-box binding factor n=1 Tax=Striga asiatica TaxID=4170 RepID=A0A5A7QTG9_STRAF|nr:G-box binding factor [Striga asiatica]
MGNSDDAKLGSKPEKSSAVATDQNNIHLYPDWAGMQAYYGPRFAVPPYMNSAVASPHTPPPYMWAPPQILFFCVLFFKSMMPPYAAPYAAFYAHGGVYAHPGVPVASTTLNMETPAKSTGNTDGSFVKKLKESNGLAMSIGNGNGDSADHGTERRTSDSDETGGSSDGSNGVTPRAGQRGKKRSREGSPDKGDGKAPEKSSEVPAVEVGQASEKTVDVITPPANVPVKPTENTNTALVLKDVKSSPITVPSHSMPSETWLQNEKELKRERRKQSNRESARRSRLRKQAETEELAVKVQVLTAENITLKSEINKLIESSEQLKLQNATLMEKLKDGQLKPVNTVNLLARVNNSDSSDAGDLHENRSPRAKLRQLLDTSPRADAVAAS